MAELCRQDKQKSCIHCRIPAQHACRALREALCSIIFGNRVVLVDASNRILDIVIFGR